MEKSYKFLKERALLLAELSTHNLSKVLDKKNKSVIKFFLKEFSRKRIYSLRKKKVVEYMLIHHLTEVLYTDHGTTKKIKLLKNNNTLYLEISPQI